MSSVEKSLAGLGINFDRDTNIASKFIGPKDLLDLCIPVFYEEMLDLAKRHKRDVGYIKLIPLKKSHGMNVEIYIPKTEIQNELEAK